MPVVAHVFRRALPDGLSDSAEWRVRDHGRCLAIHSDELVAAHRKSARDLSVQRTVGLLERDCRRLRPGYLADQRGQTGQVAASAAGEDSTQGFGLLGGRTVSAITFMSALSTHFGILTVSEPGRAG